MSTCERRKHRWHWHLEDALPLVVACGLDLLGEPPSQLHPVVWYGRLIR